ncbi:hypothetical protein A0H81_03271 [Grifola frondosa]|uniref:Protein kinase domain-containing protein n=1 Tax=Grifola frondosa TaxID=5627 RepID=A0A1C7MI83_GRIFR|nr:hypothetical protein A0H81_03271 [Grifola frondosa]
MVLHRAVPLITSSTILSTQPYISCNFDMITFHSDNFQEFSKWPNTPIAALVRPELLCGIESASTAPHSLSKILSRAWSINAHAPVICTDLQSLLVFHPPSSRSNDNMQDVLYERVEPMSDLRMIRIVLASYIYRALPHLLYITLPEHPGFNMRRFPDGAPIDPNTPMKADEEVFSSCNRHTDFDRYALLFDRRRALQFLRWKKYVAENISLLIGVAGDILPATTDGFVRQNAELSPLYPLFEPPSATTSHLDAVRRPCPLGSSRELLSHSRAFTVELQRELTPIQTRGSRTRMGRTYTCRLVSIDGRSIGDKTPVLCLKLFDDRFYPLTYSTDPLNYGYLENMGFGTAEDHIRREMAVYKKLAFAQGSIIPYFYGVHSVTTRDNIQVYGMLTEYIDGQPLSSGIAWSFSEHQKIQLVESARHAVRVLQYGDISLHDWHSGQILAVHSPIPSDKERVHCVLFDFSAATQSLYTQENHRSDDFGECTESLIQEGTGLDERFVMEHFGPREAT